VDGSKCLRAGQGGTVRSGTFMRLQSCDTADVLQQFVYDGSRVQLTGRPDLCVVYRGTTAHVGVDPIILKTCNDHQEGWVAPYPLSNSTGTTTTTCDPPQCTCDSWTENECGRSLGPFCSLQFGSGPCVCFSPAARGGVGSVCAVISNDWSSKYHNEICLDDDECASDERCGHNPCGDRNHCMRLCDKMMMRPLQQVGRAETRINGNCQGVPCA
jgi:hypothetical protein